MPSIVSLNRHTEPLPLYTGLALPLGAATGAAAGILGVGGGEFRLPFLLSAYRQRTKTGLAVNLIVGLATVTLSVIRRAQLGMFANVDWILISLLTVGSLAGAVLGARQAHGAPSRLLRKIVIAYLLVVGVWMLYESAMQSHHVLLEPGRIGQWALGALLALGIGFLSPMFGVAGGEMRIPALMYLLAIPIKEAGTLSLVASIPTVAAGALTYRQFGHVGRRQAPLAILLGLGSVFGVLLGVAFLSAADPHFLKGLLGVVLILAALGIVLTDRLKKEAALGLN